MDGEQHHYELRSRSRSRSQTPQVLNRSLNDAELPEHHYDLRSRSRERSHTPGEVTSTRRSGSRSLPSSMDKSTEKNMETIAEQKEEVENQTETQTNTSNVKKVERRSERQRAKRQIFTNGKNESSENKSNAKVERERKSLTPRRILTSDYSSEEGDHEDTGEEREDPPSRPGSAYEIYKQAGDWWNVFPKTDYTYSQKSQFRYEIAPGVLAMPNMSRRSIHSDSNSTLNSIPSISQQNISQTSTQLTNKSDSQRERESFGKELLSTSDDGDDLFLRTRHPDSVARGKVFKTTHVEQYSSRREIIYSASGNTSPLQSLNDRYGDYSLGTTNLTRRYEPLSQADSDIDIDDTISSVDGHRRSYLQRREHEMNFFTRIYSRFVTIIITSYTSVKNFVGLGENRRTYQSSHSFRREEETRWDKIWNWFGRTSQYLYSLFVNLLFLDTWLLSRGEAVRDRLPNRRSKLIWIALLPLLLLGGAYVAQTYTFPYLEPLENVRSNIVNTTYYYIDDIANINFPDYDMFVKYIKNLQNVSLPSIPTPNISVPALPKIGWNITWS